MIQEPLSIPAINIELDTLQLWLKKLQSISADTTLAPGPRAAAKGLQSYVKKRIDIAQAYIEYATLSLRIELSERAIHDACELLASVGAPGKLLKAMRALFDSLWLKVLHTNQQRKLPRIKRAEEKIGHQAHAVLHSLRILGLEDDPCLKLDRAGDKATELGRNQQDISSKEDADSNRQPAPRKYEYSKKRAGAPLTVQNASFLDWSDGTSKEDLNVRNFCVEADRRGLKLPNRKELKKCTSWLEALIEQPTAVKKWFKDARTTAKKHAVSRAHHDPH